MRGGEGERRTGNVSSAGGEVDEIRRGKGMNYREGKVKGSGEMKRW